MEPENRPYVDSETEPGDSGTEEWSDKRPAPGDPIPRRPPTHPVVTTDDHGVIDESPANEFSNDPDAIGAHNAEDEQKL